MQVVYGKLAGWSRVITIWTVDHHLSHVSRWQYPNLSSLSNIDVSWEYAVNVSSKLRAASLEDQTLKAMWGHYKSALDFAAREVLGKRLCAKKPWISQATLAIINQRRQSIRRGDVEEYRRLAGPWRRSLRHDKQWMEHVASTGDNHLLCGEIKDAFASFRQLKQKCASSAPLKALDGKLLSNRASVAAKWQEHFSTLLNRPTQSPPDALGPDFRKILGRS